MDWIRWVGLALVVALPPWFGGGCGDDIPDAAESDDAGADTETDGGSAEGDPRLAEVVALQCAHIEACDCAGQPAMDECQSERTQRWDARVTEGETRGLTFDATCLDTLVAEIEAAECSWPGAGLDPICSRFCALYHGDVPLGEACAGEDPLVSDCAQGLTCREGTCAAPCEALLGLDTGATCRPGQGEQFDDCREGEFCEFFFDSNCQALSQVGESCDRRPCAPDAYCEFPGRICVAAIVEGGECSDDQCEPDLYCEGLGGEGACERHHGVGETCGGGVDCDPRLVCNSDTLSCVERASVGEACNATNACVDEAICNLAEGVCSAFPQTAGALCLNGECGDGLWCDPSQGFGGTCMATQPLGDPCTGHAQCETGFCPAGSCAPRPGEGEECLGLRICETGLVCNGETCQTTRTRAPAVCVYEGW